MPDIELELPELEEHQLEWDADPHRFKVITAGRRAGKTVFGKKAVILGHGGPEPDITTRRGILDGARIWWVTRDGNTLTDTIWPNLKETLAPLTVYKNETQKRIVVYGGGEVVCKSADGSSLRGSGLDGIVGDENAFWKDGIWQADLRPALADRKGWAVLITTPNGGNWFYDLWQDIPNRKEWQRFTAPTSANPNIDPEEIEEARRTLHPLIFRQEYLAEFVVDTGDVFKREWISYFDVPDEAAPEGAMDLIVLEPHNGPQRIALLSEGTWFITADLATSLEETADWTVIGVWQMTRAGDLLLHHVERRRIEGPEIPDRIRDLMAEWGCTFATVEETGHKSVVQDMIKMGIPVWPQRPGKGDDKRTRAIPAAARMMNGKIFFKRNQVWTPALEMELMRFTGAKDGIDDQVDMLAYAERTRSVRLARRPLVGGR